MPEAMTVLAALLAAGAGAVLFVGCFGRTILHMRDSSLKRIVSYAAFLGLVAIPGAVGLWVGIGTWAYVPAAILLISAVRELGLIVGRRRLRGDDPVESQGCERRWFRPVTTYALATRRYEITCPDLRVERLRIVHLSDIHYNDWVPVDWYVLVFNHASYLNPDLVLITGDFVSEARYIDRLPAVLNHLRARCGVYTILGNHDHWVGPDEVSAAVRAGGAHLLGNSMERVQIGTDAHVWLAGSEDPWNRTAGPVARVDSSDLLLGLTHTPDNVFAFARKDARAVFAGHSHGGQVVLPGVGALVVPSQFGRLFVEGHYVIDQTHLFVTTGVGTDSPPLRIYCPPEILVVDLLRQGPVRSVDGSDQGRRSDEGTVGNAHGSA